jgi:hypothetical protein
MSLRVAYDFEHIKQRITKSTTAYQDEIAGLMKEHADNSEVPMVVFTPPDSHIIGGGNSKATYFLADGSTLSVFDTSTATSEDHQWRLETNKLPHLINSKQGGREFKVEPSLELNLDGETIKLADLLQFKDKLPFTKIAWEGNKSRFSSESHPGYLQIIKGKATIFYNAI